jgi:glycolate oxidase iron-sulfur subunit
MDSPRGRIHIVGQLLAGAPAKGAALAHLDRCLSCMACVSACPSGVRYGEIIEEARGRVEQASERALPQRLVREAIFALFPYPRRLRTARLLMKAAEVAGARRLLRDPRLAGHLPPVLTAMERLAPAITPIEHLPNRVPAQGPRRGVVGLLVGCVQSVFFSGVNAATARVLAADGFDVVVARGQGCCGALSLHAGRKTEATRLARKNIDIFKQSGVEVVVANAAGCGSVMKEYGQLLAGDPLYAQRAAWLAGHTRDLTELLAEAGPRAQRHPLAVRAAFHDACHLAHAQGIRSQPREILRQVPGLELCEVGDDTCCGSAGVYNLLQPAAASELGKRKAAAVLATGADVVVSTNPGCLMQISATLRSAGHAMPAMHIAEILDLSVGGSTERARLVQRANRATPSSA